LINIGASRISLFFRTGVIHGRRESGVVWFRVDEVREALTIYGCEFGVDGKVIYQGRWLTKRKHLNSPDSGRYQEAR
jgi:hypothetical protein